MKLRGKGSEETSEGSDQPSQNSHESWTIPSADGDDEGRGKKGDTCAQTAGHYCVVRHGWHVMVC